MDLGTVLKNIQNATIYVINMIQYGIIWRCFTMPRKAREKYSECIYHVMCRSVSEIQLFRDNDDKDYYLTLLKRYTEKFRCSVYAYCLMDNHLHLHLDPKGYDISKFMHSANTAYVRYYNQKYKRHGHLFQERFESRVLRSDQYNLAVSAYIHNNAKDIEDYRGREEKYPYSSYGIYLGIKEDTLRLVDMSFVMGLFNTHDKEAFFIRYREFVSLQKDTGIEARRLDKMIKTQENEYLSGRRVILRDYSPGRVLSYMADKLMTTRSGEVWKRI
jgi:REP element-mobilizing transposase RayT